MKSANSLPTLRGACPWACRRKDPGAPCGLSAHEPPGNGCACAYVDDVGASAMGWPETTKNWHRPTSTMPQGFPRSTQRRIGRSPDGIRDEEPNQRTAKPSRTQGGADAQAPRGGS